MTCIQGLTAEQEKFAAHAGGAFVHACPGAGKTHTIIARVVRIAATLPPRRGLAVLSFTNSAVDEFRARCRAAALDSLLKHPSFTGTLDAFVRHFVVLPGCGATNTRRPIILDSWDSLGIEIRLSGQCTFKGNPPSLDLFDPETNVIDPERIGHAGLRSHVFQHRLKYQEVAASRRRGLLQAGYLSAGDARVQTLRSIRDPVMGTALGRALAARFQEVIVDEGQDCNPIDLQILSWLRQHGVHVTFVCDPDQAIYEFRNGSPASIKVFKETYSLDSHQKLTGNFRSSPAICRLAATLRRTIEADESVGETRSTAHPILLLAYGGSGPSAAIGRAFLARLAELQLDSANAIVLAHSGKVAQRATSSVASANRNGTSRIESLAFRVAEFWSPAATARTKETVIQAVEVLLLDLMGLRQTGEHLLRTIDRAGIDRRTHRLGALRFLVSLPKVCGNSDADRLAWIASVHAGGQRLDLKLPAGVTMRSFFRCPPNGKWSNHLLAPVQLDLTCAKIHEAKGRQYGAVCVVLPPNRAPMNRSAALFEAWANRTDSEATRVIYVGITRAQHLSALAMPMAFADRCAALMTERQVPYTRADV